MTAEIRSDSKGCMHTINYIAVEREFNDNLHSKFVQVDLSVAALEGGLQNRSVKTPSLSIYLSTYRSISQLQGSLEEGHDSTPASQRAARPARVPS